MKREIEQGARKIGIRKEGRGGRKIGIGGKGRERKIRGLDVHVHVFHY